MAGDASSEFVILVNEQDAETGVMEKMQAHREGLLHRAFSVLIYNHKHELLLQRRAAGKYHSPGLWTNTCCSHPRPGEEIREAARRRLMEEMGIGTPLKVTGSFIYRHTFDNGLTEYEYDHVLEGISDTDPVMNPEEADDFRWISVEDLIDAVDTNPELYTYWLQQLIAKGFIKVAQ